jgi:hypothetical protein
VETSCATRHESSEISRDADLGKPDFSISSGKDPICTSPVAGLGSTMNRIKTFLKAKAVALVLGAGILAALTGCVGYVDGGGVDVVAPGPPDVVVFGGYDRGRDVHAYSIRGHASIGAVHGGWHH